LEDPGIGRESAWKLVLGVMGWEWCGFFWLKIQTSGVLCDGEKWFGGGGGDCYSAKTIQC